MPGGNVGQHGLLVQVVLNQPWDEGEYGLVVSDAISHRIAQPQATLSDKPDRLRPQPLAVRIAAPALSEECQPAPVRRERGCIGGAQQVSACASTVNSDIFTRALRRPQDRGPRRRRLPTVAAMPAPSRPESPWLRRTLLPKGCRSVDQRFREEGLCRLTPMSSPRNLPPIGSVASLLKERLPPRHGVRASAPGRPRSQGTAPRPGASDLGTAPVHRPGPFRHPARQLDPGAPIRGQPQGTREAESDDDHHRRRHTAMGLQRKGATSGAPLVRRTEHRPRSGGTDSGRARAVVIPTDRRRESVSRRTGPARALLQVVQQRAKSRTPYPTLLKSDEARLCRRIGGCRTDRSHGTHARQKPTDQSVTSTGREQAP